MGHFSGQPLAYRIPGEFAGGEVLSNNYPALDGDGARELRLRPYQAVVIRAQRA